MKNIFKTVRKIIVVTGVAVLGGVGYFVYKSSSKSKHPIFSPTFHFSVSPIPLRHIAPGLLLSRTYYDMKTTGAAASHMPRLLFLKS